MTVCVNFYHKNCFRRYISSFFTISILLHISEENNKGERKTRARWKRKKRKGERERMKGEKISAGIE